MEGGAPTQPDSSSVVHQRNVPTRANSETKSGKLQSRHRLREQLLYWQKDGTEVLYGVSKPKWTRHKHHIRTNTTIQQLLVAYKRKLECAKNWASDKTTSFHRLILHDGCMGGELSKFRSQQAHEEKSPWHENRDPVMESKFPQLLCKFYRNPMSDPHWWMLPIFTSTSQPNSNDLAEALFLTLERSMGRSVPFVAALLCVALFLQDVRAQPGKSTVPITCAILTA